MFHALFTCVLCAAQRMHNIFPLCMQMDETMIRNKCQSVFRNLLQARGVTLNQSASMFIRELSCTSRCDDYIDFTAVRKAYQDHVGEDSMQRIVSFDETEKDERRAEQAVVHHYNWTQDNLLKALDWPSWFWFHTVHKAERTEAFFSITASVHGGWRFVRSSFHRKWPEGGQPQSAQPQPNSVDK